MMAVLTVYTRFARFITGGRPHDMQCAPFSSSRMCSASTCHCISSSHCTTAWQLQFTQNSIQRRPSILTKETSNVLHRCIASKC